MGFASRNYRHPIQRNKLPEGMKCWPWRGSVSKLRHLFKSWLYDPRDTIRYGMTRYGTIRCRTVGDFFFHSAHNHIVQVLLFPRLSRNKDPPPGTVSTGVGCLLRSCAGYPENK